MEYRAQPVQNNGNVSIFPEKLPLETFVKAKLPPLPNTVMRITELLRDVNASSDIIATEIGYDMMLTTKILRLANSPIFGLQRRVSNLKLAVSAVGYRAIYDMVMVWGAAQAFSNELRDSKVCRTIWMHSLTVAFLAREFSHLMNMRGTEEAFIIGLLHDIGKILFYKVDPKRFALLENKTDETQLLEWEKEIFGYTHSHVGAVVVNSWGMPESVGYTILSHHAPTQAKQSVFYSHLIKVADDLANFHGFGLRANPEINLLTPSAKALNLSEIEMEVAWNNIQEGLKEAIKAFQ